MEWLEELHTQIRKRRDPWVVLEGRHAVEAAVAGWWDVHGVVASAESSWDLPGWSGLEVQRRSRQELEALAGYAFHRGVLGLARQPEETGDVAGLLEELSKEALIVVCPGLADAANAGAILRNAAALGAEAVLFGSDGVSPFERKAVRASGGALFRIPVRVADGGQMLRCLKAGGFRLVGTAAGKGNPAIHEVDWPAGRLALVFGAEDQGLGPFWSAACNRMVGIPMESGMDSLNVAASSAVCLWEIARQRSEQAPPL